MSLNADPIPAEEIFEAAENAASSIKLLGWQQLESQE